MKLRKNGMLYGILTMLILISGLNAFSSGKKAAKKEKKENCYTIPGELGCFTDLSTNEGIKKTLEMSEKKRELYKYAEKYFKKGRFGNESVGFIDYPKGEEWVLFVDPDAPVEMFQIAHRASDIYSLLALRSRNGQIADMTLIKELVEGSYNRYLNAGQPASNMIKKEITINGYKGMQLKIKNISGKTFIQNYIINGQKIHMISAEGSPEYIDEMEKLILKSWNPER